MIFTERQITVRKDKSSINEPVILYRGDYEVSIRFTITESKFRFKSGVNLVDSEKASHGQLAILTPYGGNVFSEIVKCEDGTVTFTLTKEMIDQLEEVGLYSFQIRLFDYYRESRVSIPPVEFGIEVREPVASEDQNNEVGDAIVGYSIARYPISKVTDGLNEDVPNTFDNNGNYNKTEWETGDRISEGRLNKIEDAIDKINQNEINDKNFLNKQMTSNFNVLQNQIDNMVIESGGTDAEVEQARGEYNLLNQRLNAMDEIDAALVSQVTDIEKETNTKAKSDTVISNLRNTEGFVNKILDVCQTYTDNFDKIVYGNVYTAWDNTVKTVDGNYQLDCSSFINLLIHGVTFYNSRYNGKDDNITNPLFFNNIDSYKYRLANQIAKYCVENGYAFVPKSLDEIRAGDIVFYSWKDFETNPNKYTQTQIDFHNNAFMKIDHVAMYLDRKNDVFHHTIQYEQYTPQFLFTVSEEYMNQTVLVARLPFASIQENDTRDIIVNGNIKKTCVNSIPIGTYYLSKKLEKGKLYSLVINGQVNTDNCYYVVQDEQGNTIYSDYGRQNNFSGAMMTYFLYQGEGVDKIKILIGSSDASMTQRNGYINWCSLYEGYKLTISTKQGTSISNIRELQLTDSIKNKFLNGYGYTNNLVEYDTHYLVTLNLSINEDIASNFTDIGNFDKLANSQRIPCLLINNNGVITSGAIQFGYDGTVRVIKYNSADTWRHAIASGVIVK